MIVAPAVVKVARRSRPPRSPAIASKLGLGVGQAAEDRIGMADERRAGFRERDASRGAVDERGASFAFERCDLLRHRALRVGQRLGGGRERPVRRDFAKHSQSANIEH